MNVVKKNIVEDVCIVLEKNKKVDGLVYTSSRDIVRKTCKNDIKPQDVSVVLDALQNKGLISIVSKSNRQTVIKITKSLFDYNLNEILNDDLQEEIKDSNNLKINITPKKLFEYISEEAKDGRLEIKSKTLCVMFNCKFQKLMAALTLLSKSNKITFSFKHGILDITILNVEAEDSATDNNDCTNIIESNENCDNKDIMDDIGESIESIIIELNRLKQENETLNKKLVVAEIANKNLREENHLYIAQYEQMQDRNNRLYRQIIELKNKKFD